MNLSGLGTSTSPWFFVRRCTRCCKQRGHRAGRTTMNDEQRGWIGGNDWSDRRSN